MNALNHALSRVKNDRSYEYKISLIELNAIEGEITTPDDAAEALDRLGAIRGFGLVDGSRLSLCLSNHFDFLLDIERKNTHANLNHLDLY